MCFTTALPFATPGRGTARMAQELGSGAQEWRRRPKIAATGAPQGRSQVYLHTETNRANRPPAPPYRGANRAWRYAFAEPKRLGLMDARRRPLNWEKR